MIKLTNSYNGSVVRIAPDQICTYFQSHSLGEDPKKVVTWISLKNKKGYYSVLETPEDVDKLLYDIKFYNQAWNRIIDVTTKILTRFRTI